MPPDRRRGQKEADSIRREAAEAGCKAAMQEVENVMAEKTAPAIEALQQAAADLQATKQAWLSQWESGAVRLASAIAARVIRRELSKQPDITSRPGPRGFGTCRRQPRPAIASESERLSDAWDASPRVDGRHVLV